MSEKKPKAKKKIQASEIEVGNRSLLAVLDDFMERSKLNDERSARADEKAAEALRQIAKTNERIIEQNEKLAAQNVRLEQQNEKLAEQSRQIAAQNARLDIMLQGLSALHKDHVTFVQETGTRLEVLERKAS